MSRLTLLLLFLFATTACTSVEYYRQAFGGQLEMLAKRRPVSELLDDPLTQATLRARLVLSQQILTFAEQELGLQAGGSYSDYAALGRPYAVWNVFATPEFSFAPREWCYPLVGCLAYRGYFDAARATAHAARLSDEGFDVHLGGVVAYSTLGWFDDPLLDTFIDRRDDRLAELLFHELAHRRLFVAGDTAFNESFATAVADAGLRRWLQRHAEPGALARRQVETAWLQRVYALLLETREALAELYASGRPEATLREEKAATWARRQSRYAGLRGQPGASPGLDRWIAAGLNNAKLNSVGLYRRLVPGFAVLLARHDGNLPAFYAAVEELGRRPAPERLSYLQSLAADAPPTE